MTTPSEPSKIVLVTGASRGIGRAAAVHLAREGWKIIALARSQAALEALDEELQGEGLTPALLVPADLKDLDAIDRLGQALFERFGRLDGLINAAGVLGDLTPMHQARPRMMEEAMAINAMVPYRLLRSLHPLLRAAHAARAVFVSTSRARKVSAYWGPYAASKAAMEQIVATYAAEVAMTPIKVTLLDPGPVRTAMRQKAFPGEDPASLPPPEMLAPLFAELLSAEGARHGELVVFRQTAHYLPPA